MSEGESFQKLYAFCLRKLTTRDYTTVELKRVLARKAAREERREGGHKEWSDADCEGVILRLRELGYLNEERIAQALSKQVQRRGKGPAYLQARLAAKGLGAASRGARALYNSDDPEQELHAAREALAKLRLRDPSAEQKKLAARLQRRGFGLSVIFQLLREAEAE